MNYEFYYYCFFYLSSFKERKILCINKRTERRYEYFKINLDNYFDIETLKLFFLN